MTEMRSRYKRENSQEASACSSGRVWVLFLCGLLHPWLIVGQQPPNRSSVVLTGVLTRKDHETYRMHPFTVPPGTNRVTVDFSYTGRDQHTTLDIGIYDPTGFRGWSGGNKSSFTISRSDATPSYVTGPITPGTWKLVIGVPNIRAGVHSEYKA